MEVNENCFYTKEHEWVLLEGLVATVGITEYAQSALGDITYIELPAVGTELEQFEQIASIESVKAASDIYSPLSGKIVEINSELESDPALLNSDCFGKGWIIKLQIETIAEKSKLMNAQEYSNYLTTLS